MGDRLRVDVLAMGGTIAMSEPRAGDGLRPALSAADLLRACPCVDRYAEVSARSIVSLPGASLTFSDVRRVLEAAVDAVSAGADGVVVTQGTDTLEETAYLLDLWWPRGAPLIVTGAMRAAAQPGADGPANLLDAILVATDPTAARYGVLVTMAGEIHAARHVRKTHSTRVGAFRSPNFGPVGRVAEHQVTFLADLAVHRSVPLPDPQRATRVAILESVLDDDGGQLGLVAVAGYDGVVLSACGVGHTSAAVAARAGEVASDLLVVVASRTEAGGTRAATYGFAGSESDLIARGAILAGLLDHRKARLLLWALLAAGVSRDQIAREFHDRGLG